MISDSTANSKFTISLQQSIMMSKCARSGCINIGVNRCSVCLREPYCSGDCQKADWKLHKLICKCLKKLSLQIQPYHEVYRVITEREEKITGDNKLDARVLLHLISYAEYQYGERVPGRSYRERGNSERVDNWEVELVVLIELHRILIEVYKSDKSLNRILNDNLRLPHQEKILDLLKPWSINLNVNSTSQICNLDIDQINHILKMQSNAERNIAFIHTNRTHFDLAESYCQMAISHARLYQGEEVVKIDLLFIALRTFSELRNSQGLYSDAVEHAREAYDCVAITYNPVHPKVQVC